MVRRVMHQIGLGLHRLGKGALNRHEHDHIIYRPVIKSVVFLGAQRVDMLLDGPDMRLQIHRLCRLIFGIHRPLISHQRDLAVHHQPPPAGQVHHRIWAKPLSLFIAVVNLHFIFLTRAQPRALQNCCQHHLAPRALFLGIAL